MQRNKGVNNQSDIGAFRKRATSEYTKGSWKQGKRNREKEKAVSFQ